jgi:zona occludens toxin
MINLMIGVPGGGKSYEACVFHILPALKRGRKVITNLPVNVEVFAALDPEYRDLLEVRTAPQPVRGTWAAGTDGPAFRLDGPPKDQPVTTRLFSTVWDYWTDWRHPSGMGPLYVIDECQLSLPKGATDKHVAEWYSLHRHYNCDVLLLTQAYGRLDPAIRDLVQLVYRVKKAVAFGFSGKYIRKVQDGIRGEVVSTSMRVYERKYFSLYRSHTQGKSVTEEGASDTRPIWMAWPILSAVVCFAVVGAFAASGGFSGLLTPQVKPRASPPAPEPARLIQTSLTPDQRADIARHAALMDSQLAGASAAPASSASDPVPASAMEPYGAFGVHLTGSMVRADGSRLWTFTVSRQGSYLHGLTDLELREAGYTFTHLSHCVGELAWGSVRRVVVCDTPQMSLAVGPTPGSAVRSTSVSDSMPDPVAMSRGAAAQVREGAPLAGSGPGARSAP